MYHGFLFRHLGIYYMLIASFYYSVNGALGKIMSAQMGSVEIVFFRNIFGAIIIFYLVMKSREFGHGGRPFLLLFRGVIGSMGILANFYNISHIDLATAFTFQKTAPIFTGLFCAFFLKEKISSLGWFAILLGFGGIILVMRPSFGFDIYDVAGLVSGICSGLAYTSIHELKKHYSTNVIVLSFMTSASILAMIFMITAEFTCLGSEFEFKTPDAFGWLLVAALAISGIYFQIYMTKAYSASKKAGAVAAIGYADILFGLTLGILLGDDLPEFTAVIGISVIIASGLIIAREK